MINKNGPLALEFILVTVAQIAMLIGGLVTIKLLSNILSVAEFGYYSILFSVASFLVASLYVPLGQINLRFSILEKENGNTRNFFRNKNLLFILVSVISFFVISLYVSTQNTLSTNLAATLIGIVILTLAIGFQSVQQFMLTAFRLRAKSSITQVIGAIARPLLVFLVIIAFGYSALSAIYGLALGFAVLSLSQFFFLWRPSREAKSLDASVSAMGPPYPELSKYVSYGFYFVVQGIVSALVLFTDRWILSAFGTLEQVAAFSALMQIALTMTAFSFAVLTRFVAPIYFESARKPKEVQDRQWQLIALLWLSACAAILVICTIFHHEIVLLLTNQTFTAYSYLLPWMALGLLLERTTQILEMKGGLAMVTNIYLVPRFTMILLVPFAEYVLFLQYGFEGLVAGLIFATLSGLGLIAFTNHMRLP